MIGPMGERTNHRHNDVDRSDWDRIADTYDSFAGSESDFVYTLLRKPLWESLEPLAGRRVLDLGCGSGWLSAEMAAAGADVVGVDGSAELLARARSRHPEIRFVECDLSRGLPALEGRFDRVVSHMVLMDLDPLDRLVPEVRSVLAEAGRFVFTLTHPCFFNFRSDIDPETGERFRRVTRYLEPELWRIDTFGGHDHYHRSLTFYFDALRASDLAVSRLYEPPQTVGRSHDPAAREFMRGIPVLLLIEAVESRR